MKSFEELKKELGKDYDVKLYEMGISEMEENERLKQTLDEIENWLKEKADRSNLNDLLQIIKKAKGVINYAIYK